MAVSQKTRYALRALFELARHSNAVPAKVSEIAAAQEIPPRFLEVILNELKQGGFTDSRRGKDGGYVLARPAEGITVGEVIRFVQGPLYPVENGRPACNPPAPGRPGAAFYPIWRRVEQALSEIYDGVTLANLVAEERAALERWNPDFTI